MSTLLALCLLTQDPELDAVKRRLAAERITLDLKDAPLREALDFIRTKVELDFVVAPGVGMGAVTIRVKDVSLKNALKLILRANSLAATWREGRMVIVREDELKRQVLVEIHPVQDLLLKLPDYEGPWIELRRQQWPSGQWSLCNSLFDIEENKDVWTEHFLREIVIASTGGDSWEENGYASIAVVRGNLIVVQSRRVQGEIRKLLLLLRQYK